MKRKIIIIGVVIIIIISGFVYYRQTHVSIWGFNVVKSELKDVLIYTKENRYVVNDHKLVLQISEEVSKSERLNKIQPDNFPPNNDTQPQFIQIMIQDKYYVTYGGSFWLEDNGVIMDSNGYYWRVDDDLFNLLDVSLNSAKKLK